MPANNSRVLSRQQLKQFNDKYKVTYDADTNSIIVNIASTARTTRHDADKPFHINAKCLKRKVCFDMTIIEIWKELTQDKKTANITIFDVKNAVTTLKVMYQPITKQKILELYKHNFEGIKKV